MRHDSGASYGNEIRLLLDQVWPKIRQHEAKHMGINHVLYEADGRVFAGVEVESHSAFELALEERSLVISEYVWAKHVGPYSGLAAAHDAARELLRQAGRRHVDPIIEIYGHWNADESNLETEVVYPLAVHALQVEKVSA